jgi:uncharacterized protein YoxC
MSQESIEAAVAAIVKRELDTRLKGLGTSLDTLSDSIREKSRAVQNDIDQLREKASTVRTEVETKLENIQEKVNKKANLYLIPIASVILLGGILALWALVGGLAMGLRKEANDALIQAGTLRSEIDTKKRELSAMGEEVTQLKTQLDALKTGTVIPEIQKHLTTTDGEITRIERTINARIDALKPRANPAPPKQDPVKPLEKGT